MLFRSGFMLCDDEIAAIAVGLDRLTKTCRDRNAAFRVDRVQRTSPEQCPSGHNQSRPSIPRANASWLRKPCENGSESSFESRTTPPFDLAGLTVASWGYNGLLRVKWGFHAKTALKLRPDDHLFLFCFTNSPSSSSFRRGDSTDQRQDCGLILRST